MDASDRGRDQDVNDLVRLETRLAFGCGLGLTLVVIAGLLAYLWTM